MKRIGILITTALCLFILSGCTNSSNQADPSKPANLREITGEVVKANINEDNNIVINKKDITNDATYISYNYENVTIGLLAVKDSQENTKVVINTCQSCGGSPYAYFVQVGDKIQCQNCGSVFSIDELDNLDSDGCNPIGIEDKTEDNDKIIIGTSQLKSLKSKFETWKGPKQ